MLIFKRNIKHKVEALTSCGQYLGTYFFFSSLSLCFLFVCFLFPGKIKTSFLEKCQLSKSYSFCLQVQVDL